MSETTQEHPALQGVYLAPKDQAHKPYLIAAFYKFTPFENAQKFQPLLKEKLTELDILGTILITPEGINGTISGPTQSIYQAIEFLREQSAFSDMEFKLTPADDYVFEKVKVKFKQEAITFRCDVNAIDNPGTYVSPHEWNDLINDPEVVLIDTRNDYEFHVGTFKGAINPDIKHFSELPDYLDQTLDKDKHKKVAMFCTGGIRCEKSTAYLNERGFDQVFHLKGGILKYLQDIPKEQSLWQGDCFVFDERITVDHDFNPTYQTKHCPNCGAELCTKDRSKESYKPGERCPMCPDESSSTQA